MDKKGQKRQGYLSWDEYFMGVAMLSGMLFCMEYLSVFPGHQLQNGWLFSFQMYS